MLSFYALAAAAAAQAAPAPAEPPVFDDYADVEPTASRGPREIVVTATRAVQNRDEVAQAITVLDRTDIETRQLPTVSDLLATTPGITVSRNGGPGQTTAVRIRGAEDAQTLVVIDGVRVNDPSSPGGSFDFGNLLTGQIERIEVLRGPNSVPWGSQAIGGVVNLVTRQADGLDLQGEYGKYDQTYLVAQAGTGVGDGRLSAGGAYFLSDGISAYRFGAERDGYRQYAGNARLDLPVTDRLSIDLRAYYANAKVGFDGFPPPTFSFADTNDYAKSEQLVGYAGVTLDLDGSDHRLAFTLNDVNRDSVAGATSVFRGRVERYEYQGDARFGDALRAVFGAEHEESRIRESGTPQATSVTSGYAQLVVSALDPLTVTGGIRVDNHRDYGTEVTGSANAVLRAGRTLFRASYGEGFKAPTLFQLFSAFGNEALQPEEARSIDLGVEQGFTGGRIGVTLFGRNITNQIDFGGPRPGRPFGAFDNIARTRTRGFEVFGEARVGDRLNARANYSYIRAKNRTSGLDPLRRPRHSANVDLDYRLFEGARLGGSVQLVSDSRDSDFQTFSPTSLDGYVLAGLRGSIELGRRLELYGRVENLFDEAYEVVSGYGTLGRNAHVGIRVRL